MSLSLVMGPSIETSVAPSPPHNETTSPIDQIHREGSPVHKVRKQSTTGGGRAWTEDEEVYLLQTRLQKMPYKHIAAHLKKTELACRLHYHQLSHGNNRRKRRESYSSGSSGNSPTTAQRRASPESDSHHSPTTPKVRPANSFTPIAPLPVNSTVDNAPAQYSPQKPICKPILPKPVLSPSSTPSQSPTKSSLRLDCSRPAIDKERLRAIYEAYKGEFWAAIASKYGDNADPQTLEEAWRLGFAQSPPTPMTSPANKHRASITLPNSGPLGPPIQFNVDPFSVLRTPQSATSPPFKSPTSRVPDTPPSASSVHPPLNSAGVPILHAPLPGIRTLEDHTHPYGRRQSWAAGQDGPIAASMGVRDVVMQDAPEVPVR